MSRLVWLASYPKSGNTWLRMLIANARIGYPRGAAVHINELARGVPGFLPIASERQRFDQETLLEAGLLTRGEVERLRPAVHDAIGRHVRERASEGPFFSKVHDAWTCVSDGCPLLGTAADAAICVVRDPRDVAVSLAHHFSVSIDRAIAFMGDPEACLDMRTARQMPQLHQRLLDWSGHVRSWLEQGTVPVHLLRYEDLLTDPAGVFKAAMTAVGLSLPDEAVRWAVEQCSFAALQRQEEEGGFLERRPARSPFFRSGQHGGWRAALTSEQRKSIVSAHSEVMEFLSYTSDQA